MAAGSFGPALMAVSWIGCIAGTIFMLLRIYTSLFITKICKSDFWVALLTFFFALVSQVLLTVAVADWGLGHHGAQLTHEELIYSQLYQWMFGTVSIIATALGKITVILFILQIEHQTKHVRKFFLYFLGVGTLVINIVILGLIWTQCTPTAKMWDNSVVGSCAGRPTEQKVSLFQGSFGAFADLALSIYPIAVFWSLTMPRNVKLGLSILFSFGTVAAATSIVKTVLLKETLTAADPTYDRAQLNLWAALEMWIVFIVSCVPVVRPLFVRGIGKVFSSAKGGTNGQGYALDDMARSQGNFSRAFAQSQIRGMRNDSDEDVLVGKETGNGKGQGQGHMIVLTRDVEVEYGDLDVDKRVKERGSLRV